MSNKLFAIKGGKGKEMKEKGRTQFFGGGEDEGGDTQQKEKFSRRSFKILAMTREPPSFYFSGES